MSRLPREWTKAEDAKIARAFVDLDLKDEALHHWCAAHDIKHTPTAIDKRLTDMNFYDIRRARELAIELRYHKPRRDRDQHYAFSMATRNLENQIRLARIEADTAPLYRPVGNLI